jgi:hypothetical protein
MSSRRRALELPRSRAHPQTQRSQSPRASPTHLHQRASLPSRSTSTHAPSDGAVYWLCSGRSTLGCPLSVFNPSLISSPSLIRRGRPIAAALCRGGAWGGPPGLGAPMQEQMLSDREPPCLTSQPEGNCNLSPTGPSASDRESLEGEPPHGALVRTLSRAFLRVSGRRCCQANHLEQKRNQKPPVPQAGRETERLPSNCPVSSLDPSQQAFRKMGAEIRCGRAQCRKRAPRRGKNKASHENAGLRFTSLLMRNPAVTCGSANAV